MRRFVALYRQLDETTSTKEKVAALRAYFTEAPPADAAWAVRLLTGDLPRRPVRAGLLAAWASELAGAPPWLYDDCRAHVGDTAETIALLLRPLDVPATDDDLGLAAWIEERILPLAKLEPTAQREAVTTLWRGLDRDTLFVTSKILLGSFRIGVSQTLVVRALAEAAGVEPATMAQRLAGDWPATAEAYRALMSAEGAPLATKTELSPYPFYLAHPLEGDAGAVLGDPRGWLVEWKWDGIRAQLVKRGGAVAIWSRGEELVTESFPELVEAASALLPDGTVLDGEILAWQGEAPLPFAALQKRLGRKVVPSKLRVEAPVAMMVYDLLEVDGSDARARPLSDRRASLEALIEGTTRCFLPSPALTAESWEAFRRLRESARARGVEGFMLKRLDSPYGVGRRKGDWWKWKVDPYTIDAVLLYARAGNGKRANLYTDYTLGVWEGEELVPVAKAYSGLDDAEIARMDQWIRKHTIERFGPVRAVPPEQVFEIAFEGLSRSSRHKAGIALRFPRIHRWRHDKAPRDADTLDRVRSLLDAAP